MNSKNYGSLYIVATPIGNLEDITHRAIRILQEVDYIAAEDTRHTKKLLNHFGITTKLVSYYREKEHRRSEDLLRFLLQGADIGLVSDAGTPGVSDPGAVVVQKARENGIKVIPIPGPSALTAALSCAGIGEGATLFHGFAPAKKGQRRKLLQGLLHSQFHTVFYESPHRIDAFLTDAYTILGDREIFIARELTKSYEELIHTTLKNIHQKQQTIITKGEFVIILSPTSAEAPPEMDTEDLIVWYRDNTNLSLKDCSKTIATDLGVSRSEVYKRAIQVWHNRNENEE